MPEKRDCKYDFFGITTKDSYISNHNALAGYRWRLVDSAAISRMSSVGKGKNMRGFGQTNVDLVVAGIACDAARLFSAETATKKITKLV
jgi:hypothetical protein